MMFKIACDAGHGGSGSTPGKRTPDGEYEWNFNDKVVRAFINEINTYQNVSVLRTDDASGKTDVPLKTRTDKANAWGADIYISFHHNANTGKWGTWTGVETHVYQTRPANSVKLARAVHPALVKAYGLRDRGIKYTNLHITRETKMPSVLLEGGFMDSTIDIKKLRDDKVLANAGKEIAIAVAKLYGLKKKPVSKPASPSTTSTGTYKLYNDVAGYTTAANAKSGKDKKTTVKQGDYFIFNESQGMLNITKKKGVPGAWINPAENKPPKVPTSVKTYTVKSGDTLWGISRSTGVPVNAIKSINNLKSDLIHPGQVLYLEKVTIHTVAKGETLWGISRKYNTTVNAIKSANGLSSNTIHVGDKLVIK
ncbi:N-acetylmuramoyl-L-alanine amidase [Geobacillus phage GR1]|nr:N-acetylmuramoyl-L-alanine amidase [Geobacillus phage GR1]